MFLVGCYRSGTSLFQRLLNRHPELALMWECDAMRFLPRRLPADWPARLDLWNGALERHGIEPSKLSASASRTEIALAIYEAYARREGAEVFGEKSPYYANDLRHLARSFPKARFIILTRHPAEVSASVHRAASGNRFFRKPSLPLRTMKDAGRLRRDLGWLRQHGHSVFHVTFDELVDQPDATCRRIWSFLELDLTARTVRPDLSLIPDGDHPQKATEAEISRTEADSSFDTLHEQRYRSFWAHRFGIEDPDPVRAPSPARLLIDEARYLLLQLKDHLVRQAFRRLPLPILAKHRKRTRDSVGRRHPA